MTYTVDLDRHPRPIREMWPSSQHGRQLEKEVLPTVSCRTIRTTSMVGMRGWGKQAETKRRTARDTTRLLGHATAVVIDHRLHRGRPAGLRPICLSLSESRGEGPATGMSTQMPAAETSGDRGISRSGMKREQQQPARSLCHQGGTTPRPVTAGSGKIWTTMTRGWRTWRWRHSRRRPLENTETPRSSCYLPRLRIMAAGRKEDDSAARTHTRQAGRRGRARGRKGRDTGHPAGTQGRRRSGETARDRPKTSRIT